MQPVVPGRGPAGPQAAPRASQLALHLERGTVARAQRAGAGGLQPQSKSPPVARFWVWKL